MDPITETNFARLLFGFITRMSLVARVENAGSDSVIVTLKNGQQFTVAVVHGKSKPKRE